MCEGLVEWPLSKAPQGDCHISLLVLPPLLLPRLIFHLRGLPFSVECHQDALGEGGPCLLITLSGCGTSKWNTYQVTCWLWQHSFFIALWQIRGSFFKLVLLIYWYIVRYLGWSGLWSLANRWFRRKQNDTSFIKPFLDLHVSYRNLLKYPSGMMSASGPLNNLWKRHTGNSFFKKLGVTGITSCSVG